MNSAIEQYLSVGFIPDAERAKRYLGRLLDGADPEAADPAALLTTILAESLSGSPAVAIPLSSGYDSRGILGAALRLLPANAITCLTLGQSESPEWTIASAACQRNGIRHERIDPDGLAWDLDEMVEIARQHGTKGRDLPLIDTLLVFRRLAARVGPGIPVLSGYFGDAISGKHLRPEGRTNGPDADTRRFIKANTAAIHGYRLDGMRETFVRFIAANERLRQRFRGLTRYDLLDFGFRQAHRIRAGITGPYMNCIAPYEDPRWVRFWLQRPFTDRLAQRLYKAFLRSAFPTIFAEREEDGPRARPGSRVLLRRTLGRGDPRINTSMTQTLRRAAESFDRRNLLPIRFLPTAELFATTPSDAGYVRARWVLSAEVYLRAGLL